MTKRALQFALICWICGWVAAGTAPGADRAPLQADLILYHGRIVTLDPAAGIVQAVAVIRDRIVAAGSDAGILSLAGSHTRKVDLKGKTVVPGLTDSHLHSKALAGPEDKSKIDLTRVRSIKELVETIGAAARARRPGDLIVGSADWHEAQLEEKRIPVRSDLDPVTPQNPVVIPRGGNLFIVNSAALRKWNITRETPVPAGGKLGIDVAKGDLTGELIGPAKNLVSLPSPPKAEDLEARLARLQKEHAYYNSLGLTSVRIAGASVQDFKDYQEFVRRGKSTVRASMLIRWDGKSSAEQLKKEVEGWALLPHFGNEWIRFEGIKALVDGGFEGGWMSQPYQEPYGENGKYFGLSLIPKRLFAEVAGTLNRAGFRMATHAVGDAAVDMVLDAYEAADKEESLAGRRWVLEHAFVTRPDQIRRIQRLGIVVSAQSHLYLAATSLINYWGRERTENMVPVRAWLDAGIHVAGGTDSKLPYVPEDPLKTYYHWVTRENMWGAVFGARQAVSRTEALRLATAEGAYLTFEEDLKGSITPGKLADFTVLSEDILNCSREKLRDLKVLATIVGGRIVFESGSGTDTPFRGVRRSTSYSRSK